MKTLFFTLFLVTIMANVFSQSCPRPTAINRSALAGTWKGYYSMNGELCPLVITMKETNGSLTAEVELKNEVAQSSSVDVSVCCSGEIHIKKLKLEGATVELMGEPDKEIMNGRMVIKRGLREGREELFAVKLVKQI